MSHVTVLITHLDDPRVLRTLRSLRAQTREADAILIADGGSRPELIAQLQDEVGRTRALRIEHHPGSVAATRASALKALSGKTDIVVFLDADQVAPSEWLSHLIAPIEAGKADFAGAPTRPLGPPAGPGEAYLNDFEAWFYPNVVAHDLTKLPMGNSAWRLATLEAAGGFDARLTWGGEDYDVNLRVHELGARGAYVPAAWVHHDQSGRNDLRALLRRKYRYNVGATLAYMKNGVLREKIRGAAHNTVAFRHPYEKWNLLIQPLALARAWTLRKKVLR